jgi:hypothetical protein
MRGRDAFAGLNRFVQHQAPPSVDEREVESSAEQAEPSVGPTAAAPVLASPAKVAEPPVALHPTAPLIACRSIAPEVLGASRITSTIGRVNRALK